MNIKQIIEDETALQAKLDQAKLDYALNSLKIRQQIGDEIFKIREENNMSREEMGALVGMGRNSVFVCESPEGAKKSYTVERLLEVYTALVNAVEIRKMLPRVPKKHGSKH